MTSNDYCNQQDKVPEPTSLLSVLTLTHTTLVPHPFTKDLHTLTLIESRTEHIRKGHYNPPKWQKNDLVSGGHGRAAKLGACVNWVEWLRTSADKRMWSGRRAVVMV